jgi:hypothetical protein
LDPFYQPLHRLYYLFPLKIFNTFNNQSSLFGETHTLSDLRQKQLTAKNNCVDFSNQPPYNAFKV